MTEYFQARVLEITEVPAGTEVDVDHAAGSMVLSVYDTSDFGDEGGQLTVNDGVYIYITKDDDEGTITLGEELTAPLLADDEVYLYPLAIEKEAMVQIDEEDAILARIPHNLYGSLEAIIRDEYEQESVLVRMEDEDWVVHDIIAEPYRLSGEYIPSETLPPVDSSDGIAPSASPVPTVSGGYESLFIEWPAISNPDLVSYRLYLAPGTTVDAVPGNFIGEVTGTLAVVSRDALGNPLIAGDSYAVRLIAYDADGQAPAGPVATGTPIAGVDAEEWAAHEQAIDQLQIDLDVAEGDLSNLNTVIIPQLNQELTALDGRVDTAELDVANAQSDINNLNNVVIPGLQTDLTAAQGDINTLNNTTIPGLNSRLGTAETTLNSHANSISTLQTDLGTARTDINTLNNTTIPNLNTALSTERSRIDTINNTDLPALSSRITTAQNEVNAAEQEIQNRPRVVFATAQPTVTANERVVWYDTDNGNQGSYWNGSTWGPWQYSGAAILAGGIVTSHMTANAINGDRITAATLAAAKIVANSITTSQITASGVNGDRITANTLAADRIVANSITTSQLTADGVNGDRITANTLNASKIVAGSITTDRMTVNSISGDRILANTLNADKIVAGSITTTQMTANTINGDRILANTLNASKIVAGSITTDRMTANSINGDRITAGTLNADKIIANTITTTQLAFTPEVGVGYSPNPTFEKWTSTYPDGLGAWSGVAPTKETAIVRNGLLAVRYNVAAGANTGMNTNTLMAALSAQETYITLTVDFQVVSGDLGGAGVLLDWRRTEDTATYRANVPLTPEVPNLVLGKWYRIQKVVPRPSNFAGTPAGITGYLMAGWTGFGTITAKDIIFDNLDFRPSTQDEISAYLAGTWRTPNTTLINGASITTGSINADRITAGTITTDRMTAGSISGDRITANTLNADRIVAGSITTDRMTVGTISGDRITANTLNADRIVAGSITTDRMTVNSISGDRILANTLNANKIVAGTITTDRMTANTISGDRIVGNTLDASKITAGTIHADRINGGTFTGKVLTGAVIEGGQLTVGATSGPQVKLTVAQNPFMSNQNWSMANFSMGNTGWKDGLIWGAYISADSYFANQATGQLRISSPYPTNLTTGAAADLILLGVANGDTFARLSAKTMELTADTMRMTSSAGSMDIRIQNTSILSFVNAGGDHRLDIQLGNTIGQRRIAAKDGTGSRARLDIWASDIFLDPAGTSTALQVSGNSNGRAAIIDYTNNCALQFDSGATSLSVRNAVGSEFGRINVSGINHPNGSLDVLGNVIVDSLKDGGTGNSATGPKYVRASATGRLYASTSAPSMRELKYDIEDLDRDLVKKMLRGMRSRKYFYKEDTVNQRAGFIVEEVVEEGINEFVAFEDFYDRHKPTGFRYDDFTAGLLMIDQVQQEQIDQIATLPPELKRLLPDRGDVDKGDDIDYGDLVRLLLVLHNEIDDLKKRLN